jgi:hypothetical protein
MERNRCPVSGQLPYPAAAVPLPDYFTSEAQSGAFWRTPDARPAQSCGGL